MAVTCDGNGCGPLRWIRLWDDDTRTGTLNLVDRSRDHCTVRTSLLLWEEYQLAFLEAASGL